MASGKCLAVSGDLPYYFAIEASLVRGIDVDILCRGEPADIAAQVAERGRRYRQLARGYALGSGNSIPDYVPVEGYLAMIQGAQAIRQAEAAGGPG